MLSEHSAQDVYNTKTLIILSLLVFLMGLVSCALAELPLPQKEGGGGEASWAFGFDNLTDLCRYSDAIIIGVVDRVAEVISQNESRHTWYRTKWVFRVEKSLKGKVTREIIINQSGSPEQPGSDITDDPLFLPKERYLLFLRKTADGTYFHFGPYGRYLIWNGKIYSMNYVLLRGYRAPLELNFFGIELDEMRNRITEIVSAVQLSFTQGEPRLRADVLRYSAGVTLTIDVVFSTGKNGPGDVTLSVNEASLPEGLLASIEPKEFYTRTRSEYKATLLIVTFPELPPGSYKIPVEYDFSGVGQGSRSITLNVNPPEMP